MIFGQLRASFWMSWSMSAVVVHTWVQARKQLGSARSRIQTPF